MPKIGMNAPISLISGMPARNTPTAPLRIAATSHTQMNSAAPARRGFGPSACAEVEHGERHKPADHDHHDMHEKPPLRPLAASGISIAHFWSHARARRHYDPPQTKETDMDVKAAVAVAAGKPLEVMTVQLEGPKAFEVLVEIKATGICHTDEFTLSGADPEGLFPAILGHEGAGVVVDVGPGVTSVKKGDHVIPLYTPECRQCPSCLSRKTNLCTAIRATQGQGLMPDGTSRFSLDGKKLHHYMGCSTFANFTVLPEIAVAKVREDAPFDKVCYIGCGVTTGIGAVLNTAKVEPGAKAIVFGLGGIGLNVIQGLRLAGADMIIGVDINNARKEWGERFGMTHFVNPKEVGADLVPHLVNMTKTGRRPDRRRRLHLRLHRQRHRDAPGARSLPSRLGRERRSSASRRPAPRSRRGRFSSSPAACGRAPPSAARRGRTDVPKIVDWYMDGKIEIDPMITHTMPLADINKGFDLMHAGESIRSVVVY